VCHENKVASTKGLPRQKKKNRVKEREARGKKKRNNIKREDEKEILPKCSKWERQLPAGGSCKKNLDLRQDRAKKHKDLEEKENAEEKVQYVRIDRKKEKP